MDRFPQIYTTFDKKFSVGKYGEALSYLEEEWNILPEPKKMQKNSFYIVMFMAETYLKLNQLESAKIWSNKIFECELNRADTGERELLAGKVAFELRDFELAKKYFYLADIKSDGRIIPKLDSKYLQFYKKC